MKIETFKAPLPVKRITAADLLRSLKPGQALRVKTAADFRNMTGSINVLGKKLGVKFATKQDGDDVLVFISPNSVRNQK